MEGVIIPGGGLVRLDAIHGEDSDICRIARISTGSERKGRVADFRLLRKLLAEQHWSPVEFVGMRWEVKMPIFLARQVMRHRAFGYSEASGRYVELDVEFHEQVLPFEEEAPNVWHYQSEGGNRQVGGLPLPMDEAVKVKELVDRHLESSKDLYDQLISLRVAREEARIILPLCTMTRFFVKGDLRNLMNFWKLRLASDAQTVIRPYAQAMLGSIEGELPFLHWMVNHDIRIEREVIELKKEMWNRVEISEFGE